MASEEDVSKLVPRQEEDQSIAIASFDKQSTSLRTGCSLECVAEEKEAVFPLPLTPSASPSPDLAEGFLLKRSSMPEASPSLAAYTMVVSPTRAGAGLRAVVRSNLPPGHQQQRPSPFVGAGLFTDTPSQSAVSSTDQPDGASDSSALPDVASSSAPSGHPTVGMSSELSMSIARVSTEDRAHQRATIPGVGRSSMESAEAWPGLSILTMQQQQAPHSRLFRSASAVELYGLPERKVRGGRHAGCSSSQLGEKKMHGGLCFSRGDMQLTPTSSMSLGSSSPIHGNMVPIPGLKVTTVKSMSYFTGSSSQLSDATMDVRYADPGSSAGRSGVAHGSIDDGHKVHGGVRGTCGPEKRVHGGLSRGSSRSSNLDYASLAGTASIAMELPSSARSSINNSLGMASGLLATGSYGNTSAALADAAESVSFARSSLMRVGSGSGAGGSRYYDSVWQGVGTLPVVADSQPGSVADTEAHDLGSHPSLTFNLQPALIDALPDPGSTSLDASSTPTLPKVPAPAVPASAGPSASAPSAPDLRHGTVDGSVSFGTMSTIAPSIVSDVLSVRGLVVEDGSTRCTASTALAAMSSSAALDLSRSPSISGRSLSESCGGVPQVCPVARTESLGFMYKVRRVSTNTLQTQDSLGTPQSARLTRPTSGAFCGLESQGSGFGGIFGSSMDLQGVRAFAGAVEGSRESVSRSRLSMESGAAVSPHAAAARAQSGLVRGSMGEAASDAYVRRPSLLEYAETVARLSHNTAAAGGSHAGPSHAK